MFQIKSRRDILAAEVHPKEGERREYRGGPNPT